MYVGTHVINTNANLCVYPDAFVTWLLTLHRLHGDGSVQWFYSVDVK